jgi:hypothetical protein
MNYLLCCGPELLETAETLTDALRIAGEISEAGEALACWRGRILAFAVLADGTLVWLEEGEPPGPDGPPAVLPLPASREGSPCGEPLRDVYRRAVKHLRRHGSL